MTAGGIEVGQLIAGQYFGEMALLDDEVRKVINRTNNRLMMVNDSDFTFNTGECISYD